MINRIKKYTDEHINNGSTTPIQVNPEFIRLPKAGHKCNITGLSRSTLNAIILPSKTNDYKPKVKSISLRKRGNLRGIRLICYRDLINHINSANN